jgi:hypothetical protein
MTVRFSGTPPTHRSGAAGLVPVGTVGSGGQKQADVQAPALASTDVGLSKVIQKERPARYAET